MYLKTICNIFQCACIEILLHFKIFVSLRGEFVFKYMSMHLTHVSTDVPQGSAWGLHSPRRMPPTRR